MPNPLANERIQTTLAAVATKAIGSLYRIQDDNNAPPKVQRATEKREGLLMMLTLGVTPIAEVAFSKLAMPHLAKHINTVAYKKVLMAPPIMLGLATAEALCRVVYPKSSLTPYSIYEPGLNMEDPPAKVASKTGLKKPGHKSVKAIDKSDCQFKGVPNLQGQGPSLPYGRDPYPNNQTTVRSTGLNLVSPSPTVLGANGQGMPVVTNFGGVSPLFRGAKPAAVAKPAVKPARLSAPVPSPRPYTRPSAFQV